MNVLISRNLSKTFVVCTLQLISGKPFLMLQNHYASSDVLVHEFCELLSKTGGKHGIPEYGHGVINIS